MKLVGHQRTGGRTDIVLYRAAITAKNITRKDLGPYCGLASGSPVEEVREGKLETYEGVWMETCHTGRFKRKERFSSEQRKTCHKHKNPQTPAIKIPDDNKRGPSLKFR